MKRRRVAGLVAESAGARWAIAGAALAAAYVLSRTLLPQGLPLGVVLQGAVIGGLWALTAMGLVLVYRAQRIVNFAQAEIGGLAVSVAIVLVGIDHVPYFLGIAFGLLAAVLTGLAVDAVVEWRFASSSRMLLTVATLGIAQVVGAIELGITTHYQRTLSLATFNTPFTQKFTVGPVTFYGDHVVALAAVVVCLAGLWWFLERTRTGTAIRAAADSRDRARLLGIPVKRLSLVTWMVAAGLSGIAAMLAAPNDMGNPPTLSTIAGPVVLLPPLAAAIVGRMERLGVTTLAALLLGVFDQGVLWSYPRSTVVDVGFFVVILVSLLVQPPAFTRSETAGPGGYVAIRSVRPVPKTLRNLPEVRLTRYALPALAAIAALAIPPLLPDYVNLPLAYMAIYGLITVSLVVLAGWAGQISLGQGGFAGVGAAMTGLLLVHAHADLFVTLLASALVGAVVSVAIGIPSLRIPGLFLSVATLAFAVPVSTFLLNATHFPALNPTVVPPPSLLRHFDLGDVHALYELAAVILVVLILAAHNLRRGRTGRVLLAVRENEPAASAYGISPFSTKMAAFAIAGAIAGVAGGLILVLQQGSAYVGFDPELSFTVFIAIVVGGLGSLTGAVLGAVFIGFTQYYLSGFLQLFLQGFAVLVLLMFLPEGMGGIVYALRDRLLALVALRRHVEAWSVAGTPDADMEPAVAASAGLSPGTRAEIASVVAMGASYGQVQVLFGVTIGVADGEVLALLGTNGAGKSTVLRVVSGLMSRRMLPNAWTRRRGRVAGARAAGGDAPAQAGWGQRGFVRFAGRDITHLSPEERVRIGLVTVPGGRGVFGSLTVAENLRMARWVHRQDREFLQAAEREIFRLFPALADRLATKAAMLSGGEQQMLTIAQALLCRPKLLLIDELSLGLAPLVVSELLDVVRTLQRSGITVIVVEQSVSVAAAVAHRAVFLERGVVRFDGEMGELLGRDDLLRSVFIDRNRTAELVEGRVRDHGAPAAGPGSVAGVGPAAGPGSVAGVGPPAGPGQAAGASPPAGITQGVPAFEVRQVSKHFGGVSALDEVSLVVLEGGIHGIIGANGAGKTTLFDQCSGFGRPDEGTIWLHGKDVTATSAAQRARMGLGRVFQHAMLFPALTVAETVAVAHERFIAPGEPIAHALRLPAVRNMEYDVAEHVDELLELLHLERWRDAFISELSTGTRRIVEIACALAHRPQVLLLDEPSSGLAQRESESLGPLLADLRGRTGATFVVIEHDVPLVSAISDTMTCLHLGTVIATGAPAEVLGDPMVIASYLGTDEAAIARSQTFAGTPVPVAAPATGNGESPGHTQAFPL